MNCDNYDNLSIVEVVVIVVIIIAISHREWSIVCQKNFYRAKNNRINQNGERISKRQTWIIT